MGDVVVVGSGAAGLAAALAAAREGARHGIDPDFGRGALPYDLWVGGGATLGR